MEILLLCWVSIEEEKMGEVVGGSYLVVEEYLKVATISENFKVISENWLTLTPWEATYWKVLPKGYKVNFFYETSRTLKNRGRFTNVEEG